MEDDELECSKFRKNVEFNCCFFVMSIFFFQIFRAVKVQ